MVEFGARYPNVAYVPAVIVGDRFPIRVKTTQSAAFKQNDPSLKLSVEEMSYRKMNIPAPGGTEIQAMHTAMIDDAVSGKRSIRDALAGTARHDAAGAGQVEAVRTRPAGVARRGQR